MSLFTADFDPLYDMFADLSHRKFSSDLDTVIIESFENGKLCTQHNFKFYGHMLIKSNICAPVLFNYSPAMVMAGALSVTPVHPSVFCVRMYVPKTSAL